MCALYHVSRTSLVQQQQKAQISFLLYIYIYIYIYMYAPGTVRPACLVLDVPPTPSLLSFPPRSPLRLLIFFSLFFFLSLRLRPFFSIEWINNNNKKKKLHRVLSPTLPPSPSSNCPEVLLLFSCILNSFSFLLPSPSCVCVFFFFPHSPLVSPSPSLPLSN